MTKNHLTENQRAVLSAAARSANLAAWPLPKRLKLTAGSAGVVIGGLLRKGLLEKRPAMGSDPVWKEESGKIMTLVITKAGLAACAAQGAEESAPTGSVSDKQGIVAAASSKEPQMPRAGTKLAVLVELLTHEGGATVEALVAATGWQAHSVRGVISGVLTKKFGLVIAAEKVEGRGNVYGTR